MPPSKPQTFPLRSGRAPFLLVFMALASAPLSGFAEGEQPASPTAEAAPTAEVGPEEPTTDALAARSPYGGVLTLLRDRTGGELTYVRKVSREVELVRAGIEQPATPGMAIGPGDALRVKDGVVVLDGEQLHLEVFERSQLRLDADLLTLRFGAIALSSARPRVVEVGGTRLTLVRGTMHVRADTLGRGVLQVIDGETTLQTLRGPRTVSAGFEVDFPGEGEPRATPAGSAGTLAADREARFAPPSESALHQTNDRAHVLLGGGLTRVDGRTWGHGELSLRVRVHGPLWVAWGGGLLVRPAEELITWSTVLALPARVGVRFIAQLPRSAFLLAGADFTLLFGERCTDAFACSRAFAVEPGGLLNLGLGIAIHPRIGLQLELSGGLQRRRQPPLPGQTATLSFPDLQAQGLISAFVRLP